MGRANRDTQKLPQSAFPPAGVDSADPDTEKALSIAPLSVRNRPCLVLLNGPNAGCVYSLDLAEVVIGRDADTFVRIEDQSVSRRHARIVHQGDKLVLEDLGSTNGTFVAGKKLDKAVLSSGDRIQIGPKFSL